MKYQIDHAFMMNCLWDLVETPSPVGYYGRILEKIERYAEMLDCSVTYDNRQTPYITLDGEDNSKTVMLSAHIDTLGLIVRRIDANGMLRVRPLGGVNFNSLEGESVTVFTRDGREYTGMVMCQSHSVHVFDDCKSLERNENTMVVLLDEKVSTKADVEELGICHGDIIAIDPRFQITPEGFVKSRFIDDKGGVAACLTAIKYLKENNLKPKYRTVISFSCYEEIGLGGSYIPSEVSELVAVDIGLIGPDYNGNEFSVSICQKDGSTFYNYDLTTRIINAAKAAECEYAVDLYYRYGTDGGSALRGGNNIKAATFGMAVYSSHGMERTHIDGLCNTAGLITAYVLGAG